MKNQPKLVSQQPEVDLAEIEVKNEANPEVDLAEIEVKNEAGPEIENAPVSVVKPTATPDPFSPENLRLSQAFADTAGVKKLLTTVPVRKPNPQDFVRVCPLPGYHDNFPMIELKDDREEYLVTAALAPELVTEIVFKTLYLAINRQGVVFFWPVRLPGADGKDIEWWRSLREAAAMAMDSWVRVKANMSLGAYDIFEASSVIAEPKWPEFGFYDLIKIAFRDRLIDRLDHPVINRLLHG